MVALVFFFLIVIFFSLPSVILRRWYCFFFLFFLFFVRGMAYLPRVVSCRVVSWSGVFWMDGRG